MMYVARVENTDRLGRTIEIAEWIAHCRRLRNLARTLNPIYSDNASTKSARIRPSTSPKSRPSNEIG